MTTNVTCDACGLTLLAFEVGEPTPIDAEECPRCGGDAFSYAEE